MDINHKLDLIQELRREQSRREQDIYRNNYRRFEAEEQIQSMEYGMFASFRLRLLTAILLFLCFFLMENTEIKLGSWSHNDVAAYIEKNMDLETMISSSLH